MGSAVFYYYDLVDDADSRLAEDSNLTVQEAIDRAIASFLDSPRDDADRDLRTALAAAWQGDRRDGLVADVMIAQTIRRAKELVGEPEESEESEESEETEALVGPSAAAVAALAEGDARLVQPVKAALRPWVKEAPWGTARRRRREHVNLFHAGIFLLTPGEVEWGAARLCPACTELARKGYAEAWDRWARGVGEPDEG